MKMKKITYFVDGKKNVIDAKICDTVGKKFCGLMFKKNSPPLFFVFDKMKKLEIHSFFCKPFRAIWLDGNMKSTKVLDVKTWRPYICGNGKYLLEIPLSLTKSKTASVKISSSDRKV